MDSHVRSFLSTWSPQEKSPETARHKKTFANRVWDARLQKGSSRGILKLGGVWGWLRLWLGWGPHPLSHYHGVVSPACGETPGATSPFPARASVLFFKALRLSWCLQGLFICRATPSLCLRIRSERSFFVNGVPQALAAFARGTASPLPAARSSS